MIETQLSMLDAAVISILMVSCLFAFFRGFVREVLSLSAWIGAGLVTIYYFPTVSEYLQPHFKSETAAAGLSTLGIYTLSLICFSIINSIILRFMKQGSDVGILDNLLGLIFGGARGFIIIALSFFIFSIIVPEDEYPEWITQAQTYPLVVKSAAILASIAPEYLQDISDLDEQLDKTAAEKVIKFFTPKKSKDTRPDPNDINIGLNPSTETAPNNQIIYPDINSAPSAGDNTEPTINPFDDLDKEFDAVYGVEER